MTSLQRLAGKEGARQTYLNANTPNDYSKVESEEFWPQAGILLATEAFS